MHWGCFVWTPTTPLSGPRTPCPGPVCVCVCSNFWAASGGPASRALSGAPHLFFGRFVVLLCSAPSGLGLPLSCPFARLLSFLCFSFLPVPAPPLSLAFSGFRRWVSWALALCGPSPPLVFLFLVSRQPACFSVCFLPPSFSSLPPLLFFFFAFAGFFWRLFVPAPPLVCLMGLPLLGSPCALAPFVFPALPLAAPWRLLSPPLGVCFAVVVAAARCSVFFLSCFAPACLFGVRQRFSPPAAPPPPPPGVRVVPCAVWCRRAVPPFRVVSCGAVLPWSGLPVVLWCLVLLSWGLLRTVQCFLGRLFVCCAVLLVAAACCAGLLVVASGCVVGVVV